MLQWTLGSMYLFKLWYYTNICSGMGLLDHIIVLFLVFLRKLHTVLLYQFIPTYSVGGFSFLHILSSICWHRLLDDGYSNWCEVIPIIAVLIYIYLVMLSTFSYVFWSSICFLWRNVYLDLLSSLWLAWVFFFFLYIELHEWYCIIWSYKKWPLNSASFKMKIFFHRMEENICKWSEWQGINL